tara:strand:- start:600 stop:1115 length:516 start_codon:yes stop_codon:yes gene_type:complete
MGNLNFSIQNESEDQDQGSYDNTPIPPGNYHVVIFDSDQRDNNQGTGRWLRLGFEVKGGPQDGKDFSVFYNIKHSNPVAEKIAVEELSRLCRAIGLSGTAENEEDILNNELIVETKIDVDKEGTERVAVKKYKPLPKAAPAPQAPTKAANQNNFDDPVPNLGGEEKAPWQS